MPQKQPKRQRLWYEMHDRRAFGILTAINEYSRECLAIGVAQHTTSKESLERLSIACVRLDVPNHIRSDNDPEFAARKVGQCLERGEDNPNTTSTTISRRKGCPE